MMMFRYSNVKKLSKLKTSRENINTAGVILDYRPVFTHSYKISKKKKKPFAVVTMTVRVNQAMDGVKPTIF